MALTDKEVEQFLAEVRAEIETIKEKATDEEKSKLDFAELDHDSRYSCIYGQMTGFCESFRAQELMPKSYETFQVLGAPTNLDDYYIQHQSTKEGTSVTALEKFLFSSPSEVHKNIISYIKGEAEALELEVYKEGDLDV